MAEKTASGKAYIGLGANLGDREAQVRRAFSALAELRQAATRAIQSSPVAAAAFSASRERSQRTASATGFF